MKQISLILGLSSLFTLEASFAQEESPHTQFWDCISYQNNLAVYPKDKDSIINACRTQLDAVTELAYEEALNHRQIDASIDPDAEKAKAEITEIEHAKRLIAGWQK